VDANSRDDARLLKILSSGISRRKVGDTNASKVSTRSSCSPVSENATHGDWIWPIRTC